MTNHTSIHKVLGAALFFVTLGACSDDGSGSATESAGSTSNNTATDPSGTTAPTTTDAPTTTTTDGTTTTTTDGTTTAPTTTNETNTTGPDNGFTFADDPYEAYTQIDRHGAVEAGTAGIRASEGLGLNPGSDITIRDAYNASNPVEDVAGMWVDEIVMSITFFHNALDDDLEGLGLVPATIDETVAQAGPVIIPDAIKYDPALPNAYPNGRRLEDPVVDITLAAVLLKLGPTQPLSYLADLPLNPPKNDVDFAAEFPFLAPPHAQ